MTQVGVMRERYSREVEPRPSRFAGMAGIQKYREWAARADAWAERCSAT